MRAGDTCTCGAPALPGAGWSALKSRGRRARRIGDTSASEAALHEAEEGFRALNHPAGLFLVAWGRAEWLLSQDEVTRAAASLDELAAHPILAGRPALQVAMLISQIAARAA